MACARPSNPPVAEPAEQLRPKALHRAWTTPLPAMRLKSPKRERGRRQGGELVDKTLLRLGTSNIELGEALELNPKLFEGWRDASEGVQLGDLLALGDVGAARQALAIIDAVRARLFARLTASYSPHED